MSDKPIWMQDEAISNISPEKLDFLRSLAEGSKGKSQKELMLYMMQNMKIAKSKGITFSGSELSLLMETVKKYSTPEDLAKVNELLNSAANKIVKAPQ